MRNNSCQCHLLFSGLEEHSNLSFDVRLPEDEFDIRPDFRFFRQHALDQFSQLGIILTGHLWQLMRKPEETNVIGKLFCYKFHYLLYWLEENQLFTQEKDKTIPNSDSSQKLNYISVCKKMIALKLDHIRMCNKICVKRWNPPFLQQCDKPVSSCPLRWRHVSVWTFHTRSSPGPKHLTRKQITSICKAVPMISHK